MTDMHQTPRAKKSKSKPSWPPILRRRYSTGKIAFQVALMVNGVRTRRTFDTLKEAEEFAEQLRRTRENDGTAAFSLTPTQRADAAHCISLLAPHGLDLRQVTEYYLKHVVAYRKAPPVAEIVERLLAEVKANGRREKTQKDLRYRLGRFAKAFGSRKLSELSLDELQEWASDPTLSPQTRRHHLTKISQLYRFAEKRGWCEKNIVQHLSRPQVEEGEPKFLTVEQSARLLEYACEFDLLPYVVLSLYCGIRVAELTRLDWAKVRLSEFVIIIDGSVAKTKARRVIELCETAIAWLSICSKSSGPVVDPTNLRKRIDALLRKAQFGKPGAETDEEKAAGITLTRWPDNAMRHTCATYSYALTQDAVRVSAMLGNSPDVLHRHYRGLATKAEAERFFALRPQGEITEKVIPIGLLSKSSVNG